MKILKVPDMSCEHCRMRIEKALKELGIEKFEVDLEKKEIRVEFGDIEMVIKKLEDIGYSAFVV